MTREQVFTYVKRKYKVEPDHPFQGDSDSAVLRHSDTGKWFALLMSVRADKLGHDSEERLEVITMKSEPMLIDSLIRKEGYHRAYHMNKTQWLTIELNGGVPEEEIKRLIDMSFGLTEKCGKQEKR